MMKVWIAIIFTATTLIQTAFTQQQSNETCAALDTLIANRDVISTGNCTRNNICTAVNCLHNATSFVIVIDVIFLPCNDPISVRTRMILMSDGIDPIILDETSMGNQDIPFPAPHMNNFINITFILTNTGVSFAFIGSFINQETNERINTVFFQSTDIPLQCTTTMSGNSTPTAIDVTSYSTSATIDVTSDDLSGTTTVSSGSEVSPGSEVSLVVGLSIASLFVLILIVTVVIVVLYYTSKRMKKQNKSLEQKKSGNSFFRHNFMVHNSYKRNLPKSLLVDSCNIELGKTVGQGEFGIVYRSKLKRNYLDQISDTVAVKTLRGFVHKESVDELLKECVKMIEFDHPNILKLIGVCLDGGPAPYIIMPFMENGSLLSYLIKERESLLVQPGSSKSESVIAQRKLMDMCIQVAKGMEYLASKKVVHRDLAARNCMIDINFVIKVADFGLAESIDTNKEYFRQDKDIAIKLPIKWLALESINDGVFSEKSDVWSFGVTCWEIFSGGKNPYPGMSPMDLPHQLETGFRIQKPLNAACSEEMYSIMKDCWKKKAELRPSFSELVASLSSQLLVLADYMDFSSTPEVVVEVVNTSNDDEVAERKI